MAAQDATSGVPNLMGSPADLLRQAAAELLCNLISNCFLDSLSKDYNGDRKGVDAYGLHSDNEKFMM